MVEVREKVKSKNKNKGKKGGGAGGEPMSEFAHRMLLESIEAVAERRDIVLYYPLRDFTRLRKVSLADLLAFLVFASEDTTGAELCDYFGWDGNAPSVSALTRLRKKPAPQAMPELLREFLSRFPVVPYMGRYRLLIVDGTGVGIARNGDKRCEVTSNQYGRHRNEMHPSLVFDPVRGTFEDMVVQGTKVQDEPGAFCQLADRRYPGRSPEGVPLRALWLADRNHATHDTILHLFESGSSFALRCRDDWARIVLGDDFVEGEFDVTVERYVTRSKRTDRRSRPDEPELYRVIDSKTRFDALPKGSRDEYRMRLRFVRVAIPAAEDGDEDEEAKPKSGSKSKSNSKQEAKEGAVAEGKTEAEAPAGEAEGEPEPKGKGKAEGDGNHWPAIVTDLTVEDGFTVEALVALYKVRWSEEVGIRYLKHTCGTRDPRCRDYDRAEQEIWGRVILASACALAMSGVEQPKPGPKHERRVDVTMAFKAFLRLVRGRPDVDLEAVCTRYTQSVRKGRHFERRKSKESRVRLGYRH